jgi:hypothetical protein
VEFLVYFGIVGKSCLLTTPTALEILRIFEDFLRILSKIYGNFGLFRILTDFREEFKDFFAILGFFTAARPIYNPLV